MTRVGIIGATGYAGAELVRLLAGHPSVDLTLITSRQFAGARFSDAYPAMRGIVDLVCQPFDQDHIAAGVDLVFLALPHELPMSLVPGLLARGVRVIDLSADFRFDDPALYESVYQTHRCPELLSMTVYGLSEIYAEQIRGSRLVGNPGCYPTSVLLPLVPLIRNGLVESTGLVADSKSGVSGAGRSPSVTSLYCEVAESFKPYKVATHRHAPEMGMILSREAAVPVHVTFVPHLVPMSRGMQTTIYAGLTEGTLPDSVLECLTSFYAEKPFVRICPEPHLPNSLHVRGSNYCDIGVRYDPAGRRLIVMSVIDNLVKGAAGQAVQNMNLMLGLDETAGLGAAPYPI
ncbi:MAG: N-acetyl-gamma-glutamyl-phosphate reductase [Pseudomonadota bacterium]